MWWLESKLEVDIYWICINLYQIQNHIESHTHYTYSLNESFCSTSHIRIMLFCGNRCHTIWWRIFAHVLSNLPFAPNRIKMFAEGMTAADMMNRSLFLWTCTLHRKIQTTTIQMMPWCCISFLGAGVHTRTLARYKVLHVRKNSSPLRICSTNCVCVHVPIDDTEIGRRWKRER